MPYRAKADNTPRTAILAGTKKDSLKQRNWIPNDMSDRISKV